MADIIVNKSNRAVIIDGVLFIPEKHIPNMDAEDLAAKYPRVKAMFDAKELVVITPAEAKKTSLEEKPMNELRDIAKQNKIDVEQLTEKEEVVAVIKAAKGKKGRK